MILFTKNYMPYGYTYMSKFDVRLTGATYLTKNDIKNLRYGRFQRSMFELMSREMDKVFKIDNRTKLRLPP